MKLEALFDILKKYRDNINHIEQCILKNDTKELETYIDLHRISTIFGLFISSYAIYDDLLLGDTVGLHYWYVGKPYKREIFLEFLDCHIECFRKFMINEDNKDINIDWNESI